ncbi:Proline racemase [Penicillium coprophilum]|uniref:Proline racemase n=1 Tax=Penicillium coprophilum TaxID=36646 RepID=UPI00239E6459|nr:Proline racemase [Penicillium coprophilum]KAJ5163015.1 Proline racemase [Penicillium coprophilum]
MYDKLVHFLNEKAIRQLVLNEPRGRCSMNTNLILPPCDPRANAGFLIMESEEYAPMSGSNTICTVAVLLETGMVLMREPITELTLDTAAGLVTVKAECEAGKCKNVALDNVPAVVFKFDYQVLVPGFGEVSVDIAWGGMITQLSEIGERIKRAVQASYTPVHPENPRIKRVSILELTEPHTQDGGCKAATNTVVVLPGRFDRSPCGTGTCARLAVLHARGQLAEGEIFKLRSIIGTEFTSHIRGITQVGRYQAVLPTVAGRAWITSFRQIVLDSSDPFPEGFRVGDQ